MYNVHMKLGHIGREIKKGTRRWLAPKQGGGSQPTEEVMYAPPAGGVRRLKFSSDLAVIHRRVDDIGVQQRTLLSTYPLASRLHIDPLIKVINAGIVVPKNLAINRRLDEMAFNASMLAAFQASVVDARVCVSVQRGEVVWGALHEGVRFAMPLVPEALARLIVMEHEMLDQIFNYGLTANKTLFVIDPPTAQFDPTHETQLLLNQAQALKNASTMNNIGVLAGGTVQTIEGSMEAPERALKLIREQIAAHAGMPFSVLFEDKNSGGLGGNGAMGESYLRYKLKLKTLQRQVLEPVYNEILAQLGISEHSWQFNDPFALTQNEQLSNEALVLSNKQAALNILCTAVQLEQESKVLAGITEAVQTELSQLAAVQSYTH